MNSYGPLKSLMKLCTKTSLKSRLFSTSFTDAQNVGFIGLGNMGAHMARNLMKTGSKVIVYDVNADIVQELVNDGAEKADSPMEVGSRCNEVVTMLPASQHVIDVYTGENGLFHAKLVDKCLFLDCSTIDPSVSKEMALKAADLNVIYMDAPVSGGIMAAQNAALTFMVGGSSDMLPQASKLLNVMGKNIFHCGDVGTGQAAKICNNMLLGISMIGTSETINLGIKLGLDPKTLSNVLNSSSGRCWSSEIYNPCPGVLPNVPSSNDYKGGFGTALMTKDLGLAQNAATSTQTPTPLGSLSHQIYRLLTNGDYGLKDFSSVFQYLQKK